MNIMLYKRKINTTLLIVVLSFFCACQSDRRKASPVVDDTEVAEKISVEETEVAKKNGRDSLWIKDSIEYSEATKKLYEKEGDLIIGDFHFGMSHEDLDRAVVKLSKTPSGLIRIADQDFVIEHTGFNENKLFLLELSSANKWTRYYYTDCFEYDDIDGDDDGSEKENAIREYLEKRFGKPNKGNNWHFLNKDVSVKATEMKRSTQGLLRTETWAIIVSFKNPQIHE